MTRHSMKRPMLVLFALAAMSRPSASLATGTWAALHDPTPGALNGGRAPGNVTHMLLLSDGTVIAQAAGSASWYQLSPDAHGSYIHGFWNTTTIPAMHDSRQFYSSAILQDGRVFVAGGEYGSGGSNAEVYDPLQNIWTPTPSAGVGFVDSPCEILPNGNMLVAPVSWLPYAQFITMIYNPASNTWTTGPASNGYQNEASWVKLPDNSILTIDDNSTNTERYIPATNQWIADSNLPIAMYGGASEIGAGLMLPNGQAFFLGGNGRTCAYTPSGGTGVGTWTNVSNDNVPAGRVAQDAPAGMMVNGKILCVVSSPSNHNPVYFYEYDYLAAAGAKFTQVPSPTGGLSDANNISDQTSMVALPDGNILFNDSTSQLYAYQPGASPLAAAKPVITGMTVNPDGSYHLTGTNFNGISVGTAYGDDCQQNTNFPLVRLTDSGGFVSYGRTYGWSSTGIQTGSTPVSTEFTLPRSLQNFNPATSYSLVVVTNGVASDPLTFPGVVWVDFNYTNSFHDGSFNFPYSTIAQGSSAVPSHGTVMIKPGTSAETLTINTPMTLVASGGHAIIGHH